MISDHIHIYTYTISIYRDCSELYTRKLSAGGGHRVRRGILGSKSSPNGKQPHKEGWYTQYQSASKGWQDIYFFTEIEFTPKDYEIANWYTSTSPDIFFTKVCFLLMGFLHKVRVVVSGCLADIYNRNCHTYCFYMSGNRVLAMCGCLAR